MWTPLGCAIAMWYPKEDRTMGVSAVPGQRTSASSWPLKEKQCSVAKPWHSTTEGCRSWVRSGRRSVNVEDGAGA